MIARRWAVHLPAAVAVASALLAVGCASELPTSTAVAPGNPRRGAELIQQRGCGACHRIEALDGVDGRVAPPLDDFHERRFVAGILVNSPEELARWIEDPQGVDPGNGMPDVGVTPDEAADIAAYLLRGRSP